MAIKVLVVDDSAFMRKLISEILNEQPDIEVVGTARNGLDALKKLEKFEVDLITLDLEMPVLDGLSTIEKIMETDPLPILVLSNTTKRSYESTIKALSCGAMDFIPKPSGNISLDLRNIGHDLVTKVRSLAEATVTTPLRQNRVITQPTSPTPTPSLVTSEKIVVIGSSTGGPRALEELFLNLPADLDAGVLVIQHMPKDFTRSLAMRLNDLTSFTIREAEAGDFIQNGLALIAPGDYHLLIDSNKRVHLNQDPPVKFLRPAIDVTMESLLEPFKDRIVGVILTGMGNDGADGMAAIKRNGGYTIAQDQATSTIYSMPRAVYEQGDADFVLPLDQIAKQIVTLVKKL